MGLSIQLDDVVHEYERTEDTAAVRALDGVSLRIAAGDFMILMGPSGSGKSTLLNLIGAVARPTRGSIRADDAEITSLSEKQLTIFRRRSVGFIFQFFNLLPTLDLHDNVAFPLALLGVPKREIDERVAAVLEETGLTSRARHFPNQLSGGEMQRAAISRAIVHRPPLIIADEPTGNLDTQSGKRILDAIRDLHLAWKPTIVMATHSEHAASYGDYVVQVIDGQIEAAD